VGQPTAGPWSLHHSGSIAYRMTPIPPCTFPTIVSALTQVSDETSGSDGWRLHGYVLRRNRVGGL
jgi:hypothetical protein